MTKEKIKKRKTGIDRNKDYLKIIIRKKKEMHYDKNIINIKNIFIDTYG